MRVPISWLSEFIDLKGSPEEIAEILTMGGIEVGSIEDPYENLGELVAVKILEVLEPEELKEIALCKVTDGKEVYTVITTAKDQVKPGLVLGLVKPGSTTFTFQKIEIKHIKKYQSYGMFLSPYEAGIGEEKDKLLILPEDAPLGESIYKILGISETVLELEITPNRGDVLSILGAARELHTLTSWELKPIKFEDYLKAGNKFKGKIEIEDKDGCFRYAGRFFANVKVQESPFHIQKKLWLCGLRPINNIVDITNYVLLEFGQPLHAFDWNKIKDHTIVIRKAKIGEKLLMLDGIEREFTEEDLVIADAEKPMVLAGIMGGEDSGVSEETAHIFLESAWFNPKRIRKSSQRHRITTESSYRFERGIDPEGVILGLLRASELILEIAKAEKFSEIMDLYPKPYIAPQILLSQKKLSKYLGFSIPLEEVENTLNKIGWVRRSEGSFEVIPYSYRQDLKIPEDLIEEVARIYGYEKIPTTYPKAVLYAKAPLDIINLENKVKNVLKSLGFFQIITYSFIDPKSLEKLNLSHDDPRKNLIEIANPIASTQSVMRTTLVPGLLETACFNLFREVNSLKIFEIGKVFFPTEDVLAYEPMHLGILLMGNNTEEIWYEEPRKFDIYDLKGYLEEFFEILKIPIQFKPYSSEPFLKKGVSFDLILNNSKIGFAGEVKNLILKEFDLKTNVLLAEIDLEPVLKQWEEVFKVKKPPKYPSTFRDVTCILKREIKIGDILEFIKSLSVLYLEKVKCIKIYEGPPIPEDEKSVSLRFWYRAPDRTLTDEEVNEIQEDLAKKIFIKFSAKPR
ncbi:phenylalanine--tRNA ligase subunit beta [Thermodesulfobacterium hydrogeniphilum]|uniref:phenylalanine--tRNA ligase subunit beta n=1 Tax=Thermodesulfobacterium hydrogeniphilum TaxID=161156 RepID=UPI000570784A|nr:phenylalanine--tRNA ligase subunit beta [Thermodesulfobacterium hydrogeniphilum]